MNIPVWIKSEYVIYIGIPPFFRLEGCPSEEDRPPFYVLTFRKKSITESSVNVQMFVRTKNCK